MAGLAFDLGHAGLHQEPVLDPAQRVYLDLVLRRNEYLFNLLI
jgi:hypothetical protein